MHGCENRKRLRRMLSVPSSLNTRSVIAAVDDFDTGADSSFVKDVPKINIGDCALFKPPQESPPFIGIIRSLGTVKENNLQLGVTWLYRPADVLLLKGVAVEAAPNEVFYSFHRDETPAASLLHPCKVAFLPKGVELPSGVSSFVCRRIYDTKTKRLWWLTEKDFIDGRQEEVDQLLHKTQIEMHATVQQQRSVRSPKQVNSPRSTSQLKHNPDSVQNSSAFSTQSKGKKRERSDQGTEPVKRDRSLKVDNGDSNVLSSEVLLKSELAKITEKGGLVNSEAVERLVQLMQLDTPDRKIDIKCRSLLAGVIAATDKVDCLNRFVQLRGLPVLDKWLQEVHKGKIGDSTSPRDHDKLADDLLLSLLRALDKLPVNLNALQMCNIGKSVNHLRSHRNLDIQRKAKILVDIWKKRVEAEMNINDSRPTSQGVPWASRTRPEVSHGGSKLTNASDVAVKNISSQLSSSKSPPAKVVQGEVAVKSELASPATVKLPTSPASTNANMRDGHHRTSDISGSSDLPLLAVKDEKSSSSSHSNSLCSSDHVKNVGSSVKEDARSSNSGSSSLNKSSGSASNHRKGANGLQGVAAYAVQRGESIKNSFLAKVSSSEKYPQTSTSEKTCDVPAVDSNNHKLIVKISNRSCSRASSLAVLEKQVQSECSSKEKIEGYRHNVVLDMNTESWQSNDLKDKANACNRDDGSRAAALDAGCSADVAGKLTYLAKAVSPSKVDLKSTLHDPSLNSMNALVESCVKYCEADLPMSAGDIVGMNLLASVAAGEMSKSRVASPEQLAEVSCRDYNMISNPNLDVENASGQPHQSKTIENVVHNGHQGDRLMTLEKVLLPNGDLSLRSDEMPDKPMPPTSLSCPARIAGSEVADRGYESMDHVCTPHKSQGVASCLTIEDPTAGGSLKGDNVRTVEVGSVPPADVDEENDVKKKQESKALVVKLPRAGSGTESLGRIEKVAVSSFINNLLPGQFSELKEDDVDVGDDDRLLNQGANQRVKLGKDGLLPPKKLEESVIESGAFEQRTICDEVDLGNRHTPVSASQTNSVSPACDKEPLSESKESKLPSCGDEDVEREHPSEVNASSRAAGSCGTIGKFEFDLNEGFDMDDSEDEDLPSTTPGCLSSVRHLPSFSVTSTSASLPASVTVAAAAKGPFVPPEDLMRNKGELRWKGSAVTSAFRRAERRQVLEIPSGVNNSNMSDVNNGKQSRSRLEIDLNVADESSLEDMESQINDFHTRKRDEFGTGTSQTCTTSGHNAGGLDLDLNRLSEAPDIGQPLPVSHRFALPLQSLSLSSSSALFNSDNGCRDFDLNNGPASDAATVHSLSLNQHIRAANFPSQPSVGFRINAPEIGGLNPWYPAGSTFSAMPVSMPFATGGLSRMDSPAGSTFSAIPVPTPFASGGSSGMLDGPTGTMPFNPDMYRGSVLSSSPAAPFSAASFQYPVFPFGASIPFSSSSLPGGSTAFMDLSSGGRFCIPAVSSQLVGTTPNIPTQYPRPYFVSLSDVGNSVPVDNARKWGRQGLDLNSGPGGPDLQGSLLVAPRPVPTLGSLGLTDEQARLYAMAGGTMRKEPESGWDSDRLTYKHPSWQ